MRILGLVGSRRKMGNTEVMVKESLLGAREAGAGVSLLRLTDLSIEPCNGCMACVFKRSRCALKDDMYFLLDRLQEVDGIVLGAPTYFYGAAAIVKMITDRLLMIRPDQFSGKVAATIGTAGKVEWTPFTLSQINLFPLVAGFRIVDSILIGSPGPAQSLLNSDNPRAARELGLRLVEGGGEPDQAGDPHCPVCRGDAFRLIGPDEVECPLCAVRGRVERTESGVKVVFSPDCMENHRFTTAEREHHMESWVLRTRDVFVSQLQDVIAARKPYQAVDIPWVSVDAREEAK